MEHLQDKISAIEELHRITKPGGLVLVRVPHWHCDIAFVDPTHRSFFATRTFDYFDNTTRLGKQRDYYSSARFRIEAKWLNVGGLAMDSSSRVLNCLLSRAARHFGGCIHGMNFFLRVVE